MPELKGRETVNFEPIDVNPQNIPYKDKTREKQRQLKLQENKEVAPRTRPKPKQKTENDAWSKKKQKLKKKELRKKLNALNGTKRNKRKLLNDEEIDELAKEARLVKKLKAGKISKNEFDEQVVDDDPEFE